MIVFQGVTKEYGSLNAIDNLNLEIPSGKIFGLLGHNGAGKSTTLKSLVSVIVPEHGEIYVDGLNLREDRERIKENIGYVSDSPDKFLKMDTEIFWNFMATVYGIDEDTKNARISEFVNMFSMDGAMDKTIGELSHGMRQKAFVIGALIADPKVWVLDEPMTGLDPQSAYNLKEMMKEHARKGNTVIFSTHVLETAEQICDNIGILKKGKLIFDGTMDDLRKVHPGESLEKIYLQMVEGNIGHEVLDRDATDGGIYSFDELPRDVSSEGAYDENADGVCDDE